MILLRVDRLPQASTPSELGRNLGLSKSPVHALVSTARGRDCLLVVDQLDALSLASRRNPAFFDCVAAAILQSRSYPNVRVLLACREFDMEDNLRLGELTEEGTITGKYPLKPFDAQTVVDVIERLGIASNELSCSQINLLSLPIHLKLLAYVVTRAGVTTLNFQTEKELYDLFWTEKQRSMGSRIDLSQIRDAVNRSVRLMSEHESLYIHEATLREYDEALTLLVSENILVKDGPRVSFFHDSFFDYMFAQWFISEDMDLATYILEQDQSLFMRSQVTQVLLHLREPPRTGIHPKCGCHSVERRYSHSPEDHGALIPGFPQRTYRKGVEDHRTSAEHGTLAPCVEPYMWFDELVRSLIFRHVLQGWLSGGDERLQNGAVSITQSIQERRPQEVARLLKPYIGKSDRWDRLLGNVVSLSNLGATREFFDFVCEVVRSGVFDQALFPTSSSVDFWFHIEDLVEQKPEWACELIACCFDRLAHMAGQEAYADVFLRTGYPMGREVQVLADAAKEAPEMFVESLMPHLLTLIRVSNDGGGDPNLRQLFWYYPTSRGRHQLDADLISAMAIAMRGLAKENPHAFLRHAEKLRDSEFSIIQGILVRAFSENGEQFADLAVEYLVEDSTRLGPVTGMRSIVYRNSSLKLSRRIAPPRII